MDCVIIGGIQRQVRLKLRQCEEMFKAYSDFYTVEAAQIAAKYDYYLKDIKSEKDSAEQLRLIDEYIQKCENARKNIQYPFEMIFRYIWNILTDTEKQKFCDDIENMKNEILIDEMQGLADFIGSRVLRLQGYKKKLIMR
jgi:hypothetical protein